MKMLREMLNGVIPGVGTANTLSSIRANVGRLMKIHRYDDPSSYEEEQEMTVTKFQIASTIFNSMASNPNFSRPEIIDTMIERANVTRSTAVSYYERLAKAAGLTNRKLPGDNEKDMVAGDVEEDEFDMISNDQQTPNFGPVELDDEGSVENDTELPEVEFTYPDNPDKQGVIRRVDGAHLVFKRQTQDGTFEELWSYNIDSNMKNELKVRRAILSGTDIPEKKTRSPDGSQSYTLATMGNGQLLHISGLPQ